MHKIISRAALGTAAAALAATLLPASPALAADPKWRLFQVNTAKVVGSDVNQINDVAAVNTKDVWAVGDVERGNLDHSVAQRWNGRKWVATTLPKEFRRSSSSKWNNQLHVVTASSAKNAWAFGTSRAGGSARHLYALRWDGKAWKSQKRWKTDDWFTDAVTFGPKDVWAFGENLDSAWHYNGRSWTRTKLPGFSIEKVSALSPTDIWAVVNSGSSKGVARYDGKTWRRVPLPQIADDMFSGPEYMTVHARSAKEVWLGGGRNVRVNGEMVQYPIALRWDGKTWQRFDGPRNGYWNAGLNSLLPDGKGGFWAVRNEQDVVRFSGGKWTATALPKVKGKRTVARDLFTIPGSTSLWATGLLKWGGYPATNGVILKYSR
ncbi:hypothetical protein [Actinomadura kijaniata]|uniref:hypothetical protein n=1 Tax=Actinomadura kijaniata TaxID=46161 RepID=UPI00083142C6|nr:hypothetical protein [Actinomadura kijaniata]